MTLGRAAIVLCLAATVLALQAGAAAPTPPHSPPPSPPPAPAAPAVDLLVGQWEGTWTSSSCSMGGALSCTITKSADGKYVAAFSAIFGGIFTHKSTVTLSAQPGADGWTFKGQEDLGLLAGGVYSYEGRCDGKEFYSTYDSTFDKGVFKMTRVAVPEPPAPAKP